MAVSLAGVSLPTDIQWETERSWQPVAQVVTPTLTGAIIVEESEQLAGRPITLKSNDAAWVTQAVVDQLIPLASTPGSADMTLAWHGVNYTVRFRHTDGPAVEARPVLRLADAPDTHFMLITIRLIEV